MRAKFRWTLVFLGLGATGIVSPLLAAEPKPSILESIGLPGFGRSEAKASADQTSNAPARKNFGFAKPGNARADLGPPKGSTTGNSSNNTGGGLLPSFKGFDSIFGTNATAKPIGESADGIEAPPPPTLEPSEPLPKTFTSPDIIPTRPIQRSGSTASTATPSKTITDHSAAEINPSPILKKAAPIPLNGAASSGSVAKPSSRRGWHAGPDNDYTPLDDSPSSPVTQDAEIETTGLIDRRPSGEGEADPSSPSDKQSSRKSLFSTIAEKAPPLPVIFGQEPPKPVKLEGRDRLSTAARLGAPAAVRNLEEAEAEPTETVKASFDLPPIISAEEARKLRAARK